MFQILNYGFFALAMKWVRNGRKRLKMDQQVLKLGEEKRGKTLF